MGEFVSGSVLRTVIYLAVAVTCLYAWRKEVSSDRSRHPRMWLILSLCFVLVGFGEYTGVAHSISDLGRREAQSDGWYGDRRQVQRAAIWGLSLFATIACFVVAATTPPSFRRYLPAYLMSFLVVCFVVVRAVSLHAVDATLNGPSVLGFRLGDVLEVMAALVVVNFIGLAVRSRGAPAPFREQSIRTAGN